MKTLSRLAAAVTLSLVSASVGVEPPTAGRPAILFSRIGYDLDGEKRVILLLDLLGKANKVKVDRDWIARAA